MSYRNSNHRSYQVWNRDLMHSDEEDYKPRGRASAYSPGYSQRRGFYGNSNLQDSDRNDYSRSYDRDRNYGDGRYDNRFDADRRNSDGTSYRDNFRGDYYDYRSGELRDHSDYDRNTYNRRYDNNRWNDDRDRYRSSNDRNWWDKSKDEVMSWFGDDDAERRRERDRRENHRGKGPKGYQRSDERIREDVSDRLSDDDYVDASEIEVEVEAGEVILKGSVTTREEKRRAEDVAERVSGVRNVENRLRCTHPNGGINMNRYTGTTGDHSGIGSSSGTTSEIIRDVRNSQERGW